MEQARLNKCKKIAVSNQRDEHNFEEENYQKKIIEMEQCCHSAMDFAAPSASADLSVAFKLNYKWERVGLNKSKKKKYVFN